MTDPNPRANDELSNLRHEIHMAMLGKSENAKDLGDLTVVPIGFAVDVALGLFEAYCTRREREARVDQVMIDSDYYSLETDTDEADIIKIRERILANIEKEGANE